MKKAIIFVLGFLLSASALVPAIRAAAPEQDQSAAVVKAVEDTFGPAVEPLTALKPFYLTGDFNGDRIPDLLVVVQIKLKRSELLKDVTVLNPFYSGRFHSPGYPTDPAADPRRGFAIIHGSKAGWKTPLPRGKYLLAGESPITVTMSFATGAPGEGNSYFRLVKKGSKEYRTTFRQPKARGDLIDLPTNGAGSYLYWNGRTYQWEEYDAD